MLHPRPRTSARHTTHGKPSAHPAPHSAKAPNVPPLIFDLDGTLIDTVYEHVVAWREALEQHDIHLPNWKIHRRIGMSGQLFLPALLRELGRKTSKAEIQVIEEVRSQIFVREIPSVRLLPGAKDLLRYLRQIGARWCIGTTGDRKQVSQLTRGLDIPPGTPVITGDDVSAAKPAPDCFIAGAARLHVSPSEAIVVGDSPWDLLAAQRMKALGVGLLCGGYSGDELERAGAYRVYEDPADLLAHIEDLGIPTE